MKKKALAREDRKRQILLAFAVEIQQGNSGEMTVANISKHMHLSASTKLRDMVMELVIVGALDFRDEPIPGIAKFRRIFSPDAKPFKRPTPQYKGQGRSVKVNCRQKSYLMEIGQ
jgi:hypothetical protein